MTACAGPSAGASRASPDTGASRTMISAAIASTGASRTAASAPPSAPTTAVSGPSDPPFGDEQPAAAIHSRTRIGCLMGATNLQSAFLLIPAPWRHFARRV
jgi:hypothetical protein